MLHQAFAANLNLITLEEIQTALRLRTCRGRQRPARARVHAQGPDRHVGLSPGGPGVRRRRLWFAGVLQAAGDHGQLGAAAGFVLRHVAQHVL